MLAPSLDSPLRSYLHHHAPKLTGKTVFVLSSGDFAVEQAIAGQAKAVYASDVSLPSVVVGENLVGRQAGLTVQDPAYDWLTPYLEQSEAATVILLLEVLKHERQQNFYTRRMWKAWQLRFPAAFAATRARFLASRERMKLADFRALDPDDFLDVARDIDPKGVVIGRLRVASGAKDTPATRLGEIFAWKGPDCRPITEDRKAQLVDRVTREWSYILCDDKPIPEIPAVMLEDKVAKRLWFYSNLPVSQSVVGFPSHITPTDHPRITAADVDVVTVETPIAFQRAKLAEFDYYRHLYLGKNIMPSPVEFPLFVLVGGKLAGFFGVDRDKFAPAGGEVFLMIDFAVPVEDASSRLSKLVLWLTRTRDFADLCSEKFLIHARAVSTAVFTEKPVSMKYRGVYHLAKRGKADDGRQRLIYRAPLGTHTTSEAIGQWLRSRPASAPASTP